MGLRIYLVEDNLLIRDALAELLEEVTHTALLGSAATETEACGWLKSHLDSWDLAVVDLGLAEGNGFGVIRCLEGRAATQKLVVLTNYVSLHVRQICMAAGADAFFDKSTETDEFVQYVSDVPEEPIRTGHPG